MSVHHKMSKGRIRPTKNLWPRNGRLPDRSFDKMDQIWDVILRPIDHLEPLILVWPELQYSAVRERTPHWHDPKK